MGQAVKWRLIPQNPCEAADLPRQRKREMRVFTFEETRRFLQAAQDDRLFPVFLLAVTSGLRPSEYLALRWDDLDLKKGMLAVRRTLEQDREDGWIPEETKRAGSRRTVKLQDTMITALLEPRDRQTFQRKAAGDRWRDHGLVFATSVGTPIHERNLVRDFKRIVDAAGLPSIRLYDLRHTAATLALAAGVPPKVVSEMLGHASVAFTLDTYAHVLPNMQEDAARRFENALFGVPGSPRQRATNR